MTRMLYTAAMNTPNHPDEILPGKSDYSIWKDWTVNGWLLVAVFLSLAADILFLNKVREWSPALRVVMALAPFLAIILWVRNFTRWIRGMDELHRRITLAAVFFATCTTFFVVVLWHRIEVAGLFLALVPGGALQSATHPAADPCTVAHVFWLMTLSYVVGHRIFNRRYQ